jgi:N-acetylglucosaminyl-diphospho-decaprenol L-rhamnosyltransferase
VTVSAVVVSHGHAAELNRSLPALAPQIDELVVVANVPGSVDRVPTETRVIENERPVSFAANANRGFAATTGDFVVIANPDAIPAADAISIMRDFAAGRPRCGVVGPRMEYPDGSWQASRRRFPTIASTIVRRTPLRWLFPPLRWQRRHYYLDDRPEQPVRAETLLGAFLLLRRTMLDEIGGFDPGYRMYVEDIDLCYRAAKAGWERWYVPSAIVRHSYAAVIDHRFLTRHTLWHVRAMARFLRKHPERLLALR